MGNHPMLYLTATISLTFAVLLVSAGAWWSADFQKGEDAIFNGEYATALREFKPLAEQGNAAAQFYLGWMYENGYGTTQDYDLAFKWYELSAKKGHQSAKDNLKSLEERGNFSKETRIAREKRRKELIRKAEQGNSNAQYQLALKYKNGDGVGKDLPTALSWAGKAYRKGHAKGGDLYAELQYQLALKYKNGDGVEKDLSTALSWASKAYRKGHAKGGDLYAELIFQDFVYGSDVRALENLGKSVVTLCERDIKCAFDKVWAYLDLTGDGNLSLSEIARFQRNIIKMVASTQGRNGLKTEEIVAINFASIIFLPIMASSILHSFDYNNNGLLSKDEVFGETEFSKLVGLDSKDFAKGVDFQILGERLQQTMDLIPLFK